MFNVYLDDVRQTPPDFDIRKDTVGSTCDFLRTHQGEVDILSLDNDLGIEGWMEEGRFVVYWLAERQALEGQSFWPRRIRIHSANPIAVQYMHDTIERYGCYRWDGVNQEYVDDSRL